MLRRVESRRHFTQWMCELHNAVNEQTGKPQFPCDQATLSSRWRTGRPACWVEGEDSASESLGQDMG